ncbi:MAG: S8 family serine peptidase [Solirubrobacteraceae bacterium]
MPLLVRHPIKRLATRCISLCACALIATLTSAASARASEATTGYYSASEVVVKYATGVQPRTRAVIASAAGAKDPTVLAPHTRLLHLRAGVSVASALERLRHEHDVLWAVPNYVAHASALPVPDDTGTLNPHGPADGWEQLQWNFVGTFGINALQAWTNVAADGATGGRGVIVAVLDTGVAYANRGRFRRSPDFGRYQFVRGYDFVSHSPYPNDHNGHGTFVAGTIAEETNNGIGLTGLAFGAHIMPVRVLDSIGEGDASVIAEGVRYAVNHGAKIINLSLEFESEVHADDIPELIDALRYAHRRGVLVIAAAGNKDRDVIPYPARAKHVIAVGATTEHGCLASYSNHGRGITLVAPGGGPDADLPGDPNCEPEAPAGRDIYQVTLTGHSPRKFGIPTDYEGTSMATPDVSATAALIVASGVLGRNPTPAAITARLKATATKLGGPADSYFYGAGLVNAAAATAAGGPGAVPPAS